MRMFVEVNLDALVGPTHHFGGVGVGNVASQSHSGQTSSPRRAALEGLHKAAWVAGLGVPQFVLPPLHRPLPDFLESLGFRGSFAEQCKAAWAQLPSAYSATFSSAFMWAANAATVAPSCDTADGRLQLTLANLTSSWHRWFEHAQREQQLAQMTASLGPGAAAVHPALPPVLPLRDEGAANHMRLCDVTGSVGFHLFVYGESAASTAVSRPTHYVARQTREACQAIARLHGLDPARTFYFQQHPASIDGGVFHNDVIATSHRDLLLMHQRAFLNAEAELTRLRDAFQQATGGPLKVVTIRESEVTLNEAVQSYLFNSQLLSPAGATSIAMRSESMAMLCAAQCDHIPRVRAVIERMINDADNPIDRVHFVSLEQSMSGGGGPACLRLRVTLPSEQVDLFAPSYRLTPALAAQLERVIVSTYPAELKWTELGSEPNLKCYQAAYAALDEVFQIPRSRVSP